jgi:hypothetical protein
MRSISVSSVIERNSSRCRSINLSMSTHDWHIHCPGLLLLRKLIEDFGSGEVVNSSKADADDATLIERVDLAAA